MHRRGRKSRPHVRRHKNGGLLARTQHSAGGARGRRFVLGAILLFGSVDKQTAELGVVHSAEWSGVAELEVGEVLPRA